MYLKSIIIFVWFATSYIFLLSQSNLIGLAVAAISLGLSATAIAFCIQHDGGHSGYSNRSWLNKLTSWTMDLIGASSYFWRLKHRVFHHTYTNIDQYDTDIDVGKLLRLSPNQELKWYHKYQHLYVWFLYCLMGARWHLYGDFYDYFTRTVGPHKVDRPSGWEALIFWAGKSISISLFLLLPMYFFPAWMAFTTYAFVTGIMSIIMSVIFQLAHCVKVAEFPLDAERSWAIHQIETTVNFSRGNRLLSWFLGGLNYQIEHHLFPQISHIHYPAIAEIVKKKCEEFSIDYNDHGSFWQGVKAHYHWLKTLGK